MSNHTAPPTHRRPRLARGPVRPFAHPQYRLLVLALAAGLLSVGTWLIAVVWQVVDMGGGPAELSSVAVGPAVGMLLVALAGGVLADRIPQRTLLLTTYIARAVLVAVTAALAVGGSLTFGHLTVVGFALGLANGVQFPAYSALLPSIVPPQDLLAANGVEGVLRPTLMQAAGPAAASAVVAASSPAVALCMVALLEVAGALCILAMRPTAVRRAGARTGGVSGFRSVVDDLAEGVRFTVRTPWLLGTLLFGSVAVLCVLGPIEVLIPFAIRESTGGGPSQHAMVMAGFGVGGAVGSTIVASLRLPRRYLTVPLLMWGLGCVPLAVIGVSGSVPIMIAAVFVVGALFNAGSVVWGTLLQRRVPAHLLGRVSSLDFFVSIVFMPLSMAVAGPLALTVGLAPTFAIAGSVPAVAAVIVIVAARTRRDEIDNPLDAVPVGDGGIVPAECGG
ncbi:MFS transporter [Rhodococcus gordoniae]|uniref:MFS transporter n=1 Tax=Rhodococcus gordoniae TaxID=223392 RepID=UPI0020CF7A17|nr:MFS transporter [Rhodococcus gordoniae]UTT49411.1 MFS transporter [Rhodococcus gordoniae]